MRRLFQFLFLGFVAFIPFVSAADTKTKSDVKPKYFYSLPEEATSEWGYQIPDCPLMNQKQIDNLVKCETVSGHEMCNTKEKVQLSNVLNKKNQEFKLIYHVFKSKVDCMADRTSTLSGV